MVRNQGGQTVARCLGVIEVALGVGLQVHREFVEVLGDLMIAVEILIEVRFTVSVQVAQDARFDRGSRREFGLRRFSVPRAGTVPRRFGAT